MPIRPFLVHGKLPVIRAPPLPSVLFPSDLVHCGLRANQPARSMPVIGAMIRMLRRQHWAMSTSAYWPGRDGVSRSSVDVTNWNTVPGQVYWISRDRRGDE
jgi:hypothetical protein